LDGDEREIATALSESANGEPQLKVDPLERIARNFDAVAFRQAALMLTRWTPPAGRPDAGERAQKLAVRRKITSTGLLLEAERLYQSALAVDSRVAEAHAAGRVRSGPAMPTARAKRLMLPWSLRRRPMHTWCWRGWIWRRTTWTKQTRKWRSDRAESASRWRRAEAADRGAGRPKK